MPIIATAAWSIPKTVASRFPAEGNGLSRYASLFTGVEVNSTFYRMHRASTFAGWAQSVPEDFRFAVKMPKDITHSRRLKEIRPAFETFIEQISPLGKKLGPLLCQLPPSLGFDADEAVDAFSAMRAVFTGQIVLEVRHRSWAGADALALLRDRQIDRVFADPAPVWKVEDFADAPRYMRLHGSPRIYYSSYAPQEIAAALARLDKDSWCVFDNTASGAAIENALAMRDLAATPRPGSP